MSYNFHIYAHCIYLYSEIKLFVHDVIICFKIIFYYFKIEGVIWILLHRITLQLFWASRNFLCL
jgi:hypothetical protein